MINAKFKKTLNLFIWMFIILFLLSTSFTWINFYQFKSDSEKYQNEMSMLIASDIKNRYESTSVFINSINPFISETIEKSLYSIERELNINNKHVDNRVLESLKKQYNLTNIYVLNEKGIVTYATDPKEIGKYTREFSNKQDKLRWEKSFKRIVKTKEVYVEDNFYRSEIYPHRYHKWGYKGIGYIDNIGLVVLEVGIQVMDIKDESVSSLIKQVVDMNKINKNIISLELINLPPSQNKLNNKKEQIRKDNGDIVTIIKAKAIDNADIQIKVITHFSTSENNVNAAFNNALIWTIFYAIFSFLVCLLFYYRFSLPLQYIDREVVEESIKRNS